MYKLHYFFAFSQIEGYRFVNCHKSVVHFCFSEVAPYGITVNCVAPGPTQTGWIDAQPESAVLPLIPMGALIPPRDIAETILFLCSAQARYLTGQVIKVSGGKAL